MTNPIESIAPGERAEGIAELILAAFRGLEAEAIIQVERGHLTRFAGGAIHQNVGRISESASIRVIEDGKQGRVDLNRFDPESLKHARARALAIARAMPEDPDLLDLPGPQEYDRIDGSFRSTVNSTPEDRAATAAEADSRAGDAGLTAAGSVSVDHSFVALANTRGLRAGQENTTATFSLTVYDDQGSGWAERTSPDLDRIAVAEVIDTAVAKAVRSRGATAIPAGRYTVVLEPAAVSDILLFMSWEGFGAVPYLEGRSFLSESLGQKIISEVITIFDDARDPDAVGGLPFDMEGIPRRRVTLIDRGMAAGIVHDRLTARKANAQNTGHSLPQPNSSGPMPWHLKMAPGDSRLESLAEGVERGLWVTRFHYTNSIDPKRLVLTGMTRDGTFLIENGQVTRPVTNLRFTESMVEALNRVEAVGDKSLPQSGTFGGNFAAPALRIADFNFSSETSF